MKRFPSSLDAKEYLSGRIAEESRRTNVALSVLERKMLYFSETGWTLPDMMKVSAEFDRDYDQNEYEQKIAGLVANITAERHHHNEEEEEKWDAAVDKLSEGDHYVSVLIEAADSPGGGFLPSLDKPAVRPPHDRLKLWLTAIGLVFAFFVVRASANWFFRTRLWAATGWDLDDRNISGVAVIFLVVAVVSGRKLYRAIRRRSHRP